jgi:hypothetical protein
MLASLACPVLVLSGKKARPKIGDLHRNYAPKKPLKINVPRFVQKS